MKNLFKKVILIVLSLIMVVGVVACDTSNTVGGIKMENPKGTITPSLSPWEEELDTTHEINVTPGTKDLVVNGQTEYKIVVPENPANKETTYGATEISQFLLLSNRFQTVRKMQFGQTPAIFERPVSNGGYALRDGNTGQAATTAKHHFIDHRNIL